MTWFKQGETNIYFEEGGAGEAVLLLPGWGGSIDDLAPLRAALEPNFRVIAADLPGSGKSGPQPRTYTPSYYQDDAATLLAMLEQIGASPAHIVGFSDGGEYALLMAAKRPASVRTIVTWGSAGSLGTNVQMAEAMASLIDDPIPPMQEYSAYMKAAYGEANARIMTQSAARSFVAIMEAGGNISRSLASGISVPALLITGEHDFMATPSLVEDMARAIPHGEFIEVKGASHAVHHEQPAWLIDTVVNRLSRTGAAQPARA